MATLLDVAILRTPVPRSAPRTVVNASPSSSGPLADNTTSEAPANATGDDTAIDTAPSPVAVASFGREVTAATVADVPAVRDTWIDIADDDGTSTILRARCDDVARRVIREGGHISMAALAREVGTTPPTLKRLMATKVYRETYNQVSDELLGTIDDRIADERLDTLTRGDTLQRRALTVLSEAMMIARGHMVAVAEGRVVARPQLLKVAVDAAAEVRQVVSARSAVAGANGATVNVNITRNQATVIQGAFRESGVDLSDVLGEVFGNRTIPAAVVEKE